MLLARVWEENSRRSIYNIRRIPAISFSRAQLRILPKLFSGETVSDKGP